MRTVFGALLFATVLVTGMSAQDQEIYNQRDEGVTAPILIRDVKPNYPAGARKRKAEGVVEVAAVVRNDGKVGDVQVTRPLDPELDAEAVRSVKQWKFKPGTKKGKPVNVRVTAELSFYLRK